MTGGPAGLAGLAGLRTLWAHALRRDRWLILGWGAAIALLYWSQAISIDRLYPQQAELDRMAAAMEGNSAMIALAGPARALNTIGGQVTWQAGAFGAVAAGLMSMMIVVRHTRAQEESGLDDLVRSGAVGRLAPPAAALLTAAVANVVAGTLVTLSLVAYPLAVADSVALGLGLGLCGLCFTGTALVAAQLVSSARVARGIAGSVLAVAYALRAVGDIGAPALSWLSPIGWYQAMHAFSGVRWWPALLLVAAAVVNLSIAGAVLVRRDIGSGLLAARPGPARAGRGLSGPSGLAWRLQRPGVIGWSVGLFLSGLAYGALGTEVEDLVGDSPMGRELMAQGAADLVDGFFATVLIMMALLACGFAVSSAVRPRAEEDAGHAELLLSTPMARNRWLLSWAAITVLGTLVLLVAGALGVGVGYALVTSDATMVFRFVLPQLQYAVGVLVLAGAARFVLGWAPHRIAFAWAPLVLAVVVMLLGEPLDLPRWLQVLSPFEHLPLLPAQDPALAPVVALAAVALALGASGQLGCLRRDIG